MKILDTLDVCVCVCALHTGWQQALKVSIFFPCAHPSPNLGGKKCGRNVDTISYWLLRKMSSFFLLTRFFFARIFLSSRICYWLGFDTHFSLIFSCILPFHSTNVILIYNKMLKINNCSDKRNDNNGSRLKTSYIWIKNKSIEWAHTSEYPFWQISIDSAIIYVVTMIQ